MKCKTIGDYEVVWLGEESTDLTGKQFLRLDVRQLKETSPTAYWFGEGKLYKVRSQHPYHPNRRQSYPGPEDTDEGKKRAVLQAVTEWESFK